MVKRRKNWAQRASQRAHAADAARDLAAEADERRAANRAAVFSRLEKRADERSREQSRAAIAKVRGKTGLLLGKLTDVARRRPESALPEEVEPALVRLEAAAVAPVVSNSDTTGGGDGDAAAANNAAMAMERVVAEALEEISDVVETHASTWTCAETVLCLGALASALPTRAQRSWTGATVSYTHLTLPTILLV